MDALALRKRALYSIGVMTVGASLLVPPSSLTRVSSLYAVSGPTRRRRGSQRTVC